MSFVPDVSLPYTRKEYESRGRAYLPWFLQRLPQIVTAVYTLIMLQAVLRGAVEFSLSWIFQYVFVLALFGAIAWVVRLVFSLQQTQWAYCEEWSTKAGWKYLRDADVPTHPLQQIRATDIHYRATTDTPKHILGDGFVFPGGMIFNHTIQVPIPRLTNKQPGTAAKSYRMAYFEIDLPETARIPGRGFHYDGKRLWLVKEKPFDYWSLEEDLKEILDPLYDEVQNQQYRLRT